jgi:replicative DNA helicase
VYVDYAQLLYAEGFKRDDLRGSMTHISKSLKGLAKSMKVPVVLLSQLRRPGAGQKDSRPSMHDLKESSGLEQDADAVLLIWQPEEMRSTGRAELIVEKNRHGEACDLSLGFVGETTSFVNLEMA